jgi:uncharacterized protein YcnI
MRFQITTLLAAFGCLLSTNPASAHVGFSSATAPANTTIEASFDVGHGCEGLDTYSVKINIPAGVTGLRVVEHQSFATVTVEKDATDTIKSVTFTKAQSAVRASDDTFYKLMLRFKLPNAPFTRILFPTLQVCKSADGTKVSQRDWAAAEETTLADGGMADPAPALILVPARVPGWNKFTAAADIAKFKVETLYKDALIVWAGESAYSSNPTTLAQIKAEDGVDVLETIQPGTEFWVKY